MYMYAKTDRDRVEHEKQRYLRFFLGVRGLIPLTFDWEIVDRCFFDADLPLFVARDVYRDGACHFVGADDYSMSAAKLYIHRVVGHRVRERDVKEHPRLCVLWAKRIVGGRWRAAEDVICSDHIAARLYAQHVIGGQLPSSMHNRLVMETFLSRDPVLDPYFSSCTNF